MECFDQHCRTLRDTVRRNNQTYRLCIHIRSVLACTKNRELEEAGVGMPIPSGTVGRGMPAITDKYEDLKHFSISDGTWLIKKLLGNADEKAAFHHFSVLMKPHSAYRVSVMVPTTFALASKSNAPTCSGRTLYGTGEKVGGFFCVFFLLETNPQTCCSINQRLQICDLCLCAGFW